MTRELKLNNPMGLKQSEDKFQGEKIPSSDPVFKEFITMFEGLRAGGVVLLTYFNVHGLKTITDIITRWAPDIENNTQAYIHDVCQRTGYPADRILNLEDPTVLGKLISAIVYHENGIAADSAMVAQVATMLCS